MGIFGNGDLTKNAHFSSLLHYISLVKSLLTVTVRSNKMRYPGNIGYIHTTHEMPLSKKVAKQVSRGMYTLTLLPLATNSTTACRRPIRCKKGRNCLLFAALPARSATLWIGGSLVECNPALFWGKCWCQKCRIKCYSVPENFRNMNSR